MIDETQVGLNTTQAWYWDLIRVYTAGAVVSPRGLTTRELIGYQSAINMQRPIITCPYRQLGYKFMFAEAAWILGGGNDVATISPYARDISKFSDDGETFFGAYGPKIFDQLDYVIKALADDTTSRQAVINIWREKPPITKDVPCTLSVQFVIRNGYLCCLDTMRSSDLWLGHPYDIFNFSMLSLYLILKLREQGLYGLKLGLLTLTAGSKHLYETNFEKVKVICQEARSEETRAGYLFDAVNFDSPEHFVDWLWSVANKSSEEARQIACQE
jgi:thymidylate synthase